MRARVRTTLDRAALVTLLVLLGALLPTTAVAAPDIERLAGASRADTAAALARSTTSSPDRINLVASTDFADALTAGAAAAVDGGVVALLDPGGVPAATAALLADHPAAAAVIVGGEARLPEALEGEVAQAHGNTPDRVAGNDRYDTAAVLARRTFPGGAATVWLTSGTQAPDALSAGAASAATGGALLLTRPDLLPASTVEALRALDPDRVVVAGGAAAVSDDVLAAVDTLLGAGTAERVAGADRYATAAAVAGTAFEDPAAAVLTTGLGWADALAATPLAGVRGAPILLVPRRCVPAETGAALTGVARVTIAGGPVAVSPRIDTLSACAGEIATVTAGELGASWRSGCPVGPADLRRVTVDHRRLPDGTVAVGSLIVHRDVARQVIGVFDQLFAAGFRIDHVTNVADYGGDDDRAMAANATTAFNCRTVAGTSSWSEHAYGTALDLNPVQNPYVSPGGSVSPPAGTAYLDRGDVRPGMIVAGGPVERAFAGIGWGWGGNWRSSRDYQHFSASGR